MQIPEEKIDEAIRALISAVLTPDEIERRVADAIQQRIGTITIPELARQWHCDEKTARRLLRKFRADIVYLSAKLPRVSVAEIHRIERERSIKASVKRRVVSHQPFTLVTA